jgi:hypothetical protein
MKAHRAVVVAPSVLAVPNVETSFLAFAAWARSTKPSGIGYFK